MVLENKDFYLKVLEKFVNTEKANLIKIKRLNKEQIKKLEEVLNNIINKYLSKNYRILKDIAKEVIYYLLMKESAYKLVYLKTFLSKAERLPCHILLVLVSSGYSIFNLDNEIYGAILELRDEKKIEVIEDEKSNRRIIIIR